MSFEIESKCYSSLHKKLSIKKNEIILYECPRCLIPICNFCYIKHITKNQHNLKANHLLFLWE